MSSTDDRRRSPVRRTPVRRRVRGVVVAAVMLGALLVTGCSPSNSATATATPTPASTQPFDSPHATARPTPGATTPVSPAQSATATPSTTPTAPRSTATPSRTVSPSPTASPDPTGDTFALIRRIGTPGKGRYTITYDPVIRCTKDAVKAKTADKACAAKPTKTATDGSWVVNPATTTLTLPLAPSVSGQVYPAGVSYDVTATNLAKQRSTDGTIFDWSDVTVYAQVDVNDAGQVAKLQGTLLSE